MSASGANRSAQTIEQIDELIEKDQLTTRSGLRLAFSALRDAISIVQEVGDRIKEIGTKIDGLEKRVDVLWTFYRAAMWAVTILGGLMIGLIWGLLTGQAHITFGAP